jgi:NADH-quinone oxidoreductase subunit L
MHEAGTVDYLRWIVVLPLIGAAINGLAGAPIQRALGKRAISVIACTPVIGAFLVSVRAFWHLRGLEPAARLLIDRWFTWLDIGGLRADVAFQLDPLSAVMILVVTGVGGLIHLYSVAYMHEDRAYWRYFAFLNLFTFSMLTLVLGDNVLLLFVGWEGVGLCSYALIGFWYHEWANATAGNKAFIVNRIGDFGFTLGAFLLFWSLAQEGHGTLTFRELAAHVHLLTGKTFWGWDIATLVTLLMFVGATGKSAQIPLYVWLPDAMAGPTPVSALIHAATMVTAGVYMIARMNFLYSMAPDTLTVVATIGALTAFFAATIGTAQYDIKRVLAYSTVSQLGYMFLAMGSAAYAAGIFHLMTHAFFKACLFLGSGSVIHAMHHEQDMRKMGGLKRWLPRTYWTFLLSTIAIAGIPPTSGFFSKDEILWKAFSSGHVLQWALGFAAAGITAFYMFRQVYLTFHGECRADHHTQEHLHESPALMTVPLVILAALALGAGVLGVPHALGGANRFEQWLAPVVSAGHGAAHGAAPAAHHVEPIEYVLMAAAVGVAALGILIARAMYRTGSLRPETVSDLFRGGLYRVVYNKYYVDELYQVVIVNGTLALARLSALFDQYVIDGIVNGAAAVTRVTSWLHGLFDNYVIDGAVNGIAAVSAFIGSRVRRLQTGLINAYLYVIVLAVVGVMMMRLL